MMAGHLLLNMKRYASPAGTATTSNDVTKYCANSPAIGALNGRLLAKNLEKGSPLSLEKHQISLDTEAKILKRAKKKISIINVIRTFVPAFEPVML